MAIADKPAYGTDRIHDWRDLAISAPSNPLAIAKAALVYIADNTLDKWSRLKANEALTRIRELENA